MAKAAALGRVTIRKSGVGRPDPMYTPPLPWEHFAGAGGGVEFQQIQFNFRRATRRGEILALAKFRMAKFGAEKLRQQSSNTTGKSGTISQIVARE